MSTHTVELHGTIMKIITDSFKRNHVERIFIISSVRETLLCALHCFKGILNQYTLWSDVKIFFSMFHPFIKFTSIFIIICWTHFFYNWISCRRSAALTRRAEICLMHKHWTRISLGFRLVKIFSILYTYYLESLRCGLSVNKSAVMQLLSNFENIFSMLEPKIFLQLENRMRLAWNKLRTQQFCFVGFPKSLSIGKGSCGYKLSINITLCNMHAIRW